MFFPKEIQSSKQGYMFQNDDDTWYFNPGRKQKYTNKINQLSDLHAITESLILFKKIIEVGYNQKLY